MAQDFFIFIREKTYTLFLILREKTRPDKNLEEESKNKGEKTLDNFDENFNENMNVFIQKGRSKSEFNISNIRLSTMTNLKQRKYSSIDGEEKVNDDSVSNDNISKKENEFVINDNLSFSLNLFCTQKNKENQVCNFSFDLNINNIFNENKKYIEFKCLKCEKLQELTITCKYRNESNETYVINSKLYSPLTLLENKWFKNNNELNLSYVTENHLDEYFSALFYFYEQSLLCDFLLPGTTIKKNLEVDNNSNFSLTSEKISLEEKNVRINDSKFGVELNNEKINLVNTNGPRNSFFDISDQKQNFFEMKSNTNKKKSSLIIGTNIKKKLHPTKKSVGFAIKTKKVEGQKKSVLSYSSFLNK